MRHTPLLLSVVLILSATALGDERARQLADEVMQASGIEAWNDVKRVRFTFNVTAMTELGEKEVISASHDWDRAAGTDTVTWNGKTVTVDLANPGDNADAQAAFARWTNDAYWLIAPLKLADGGLKLAHRGEREKEGKQYEILHLSFETVGLTPGDQYELYVNPQSRRIEWWVYMPNPRERATFTWEGYRTFDGVTLSTEHRAGLRRIFFTDISVEK